MEVKSNFHIRIHKKLRFQSVFYHIKPVIDRSDLILLRIEQLSLSGIHDIHYPLSGRLIGRYGLCRDVFIMIAFFIWAELHAVLYVADALIVMCIDLVGVHSQYLA